MHTKCGKTSFKHYPEYRHDSTYMYVLSFSCNNACIYWNICYNSHILPFLHTTVHNRAMYLLISRGTSLVWLSCLLIPSGSKDEGRSGAEKQQQQQNQRYSSLQLLFEIPTCDCIAIDTTW